MATLAIKGHATRGKEVIEILEMLGGKIRHDRLAGNELFSWYYINRNGYIDYKHYSLFDDTTVFTIEEFLKKHPYKVGDKVLARGSAGEITDMKWQGDSFFTTKSGGEVVYTVMLDTEEEITFLVEDLQPNKEQETMDKANKAVFDVNSQCSDIMNFLINKETLEELKINISPMQMGGAQVIIPIPKGYEFAGVDDDNQQVVFERIKPKYPKYPKTHEECCDVLGLPYMQLGVSGYKCEILHPLQQLLLYRDAYWKLTGDWKPEWANDSVKYIITVAENKIFTDVSYFFNYILSFQTEEMRDAFYENFKDLIEQCKELL